MYKEYLMEDITIHWVLNDYDQKCPVRIVSGNQQPSLKSHLHSMQKVANIYTAGQFSILYLLWCIGAESTPKGLY